MKVFYLSVILLQINLFLQLQLANCYLYSNGVNHKYESISGISRISRKTVASSIQNGGVYKIENERDSMYLTARNGVKTPGISVLKKWANHPNQLWEASKIDKGYILKPLLNEFNTVTSQIENNAHSYNIYHFQSIGNGHWLIMNVVSSLCVTNSGSKSLVKITKCNKGDKGQRWKFFPVQKK